jgi:hypothetical protein
MENDRHEHQERADQGGADGVPDPVVDAGSHADAKQREDQTKQIGRFSSRMTGSLRALAVVDEGRPRALAADLVALRDGAVTAQAS